MITSDSTISQPPDGLTRRDDRAHTDAAVEEWTFSWWSSDASTAGFAMYRLFGRRRAWYCWGLSRVGQPFVQVVESDLSVRRDPMIAKAEAFWAEFTCESPFEQWTLGNEMHAVALSDPSDALGRAYGDTVPMASDLEWYATERAIAVPCGYAQTGVIVGDIETERGVVTVPEMRSVRTHRWTTDGDLPSLFDGGAVAHLGRRVAFRFDDDSRLDLVLTPDGWSTRR
ncbi:MAG: hypothetical protein O3C62_03090 [Actinomycetota bacterium]|nr:hypothetical protein [Actinomycetota bacterium]MDA2970739.1 hypothetical protein [Actinomycetota bacterium]MDA3000649.1 hypothetical protein [Actinomycetota bacterium]